MSKGMSTFAIKGGFGDFLQCLPFMLFHPYHRYLVASHNDHVVEFFATVGLKVEELSLGKLTGIDNCPRRLFFNDNPFPRQPAIFTGDRPVIGVHLGGSDYSLNIEKRFGFPSKALPLAVLGALVSACDQYDFLLFGSTDELAELVVRENSQLRFVDNVDVTVSLSHVAECSALIGSDSAFKTMSAMLHIPTIVWVGDYRDDHRDEKFINPYVKQGVMTTFRYKDLTSDNKVNAGVSLCLEQLARLELRDARAS